MFEEFRTCADFPLYAVSNLGRIKRLAVTNGTGRGYPRQPQERFLRPSDAQLVLRRDGRDHSVELARLILEAFVGPSPSKTHKARHLDDDRSNNTLSNLAWGTQKENVADALRNDRFGSKFKIWTAEERAKLSEVRRGRVWITNGLDTKFVVPPPSIPEGWWRGRR
jgi:hypothetical protein